MPPLTNITPAEPRVSVIIRTRNRPELLDSAIANVLSQSYTDREVIIVDDGDDPEIVRAIVEKVGDPLVRVVDETSGAHGRSRAANSGVRAASGEFVVLHDDDDAWLPEFLAESVDYLTRHPEAAAVSARTEVVIHHLDSDGGAERLERGLLNQELSTISIPDMMRANRITTISLLYRSAVHQEVGFYDESLDVHEDWEFYLRLIARHPVGLLPLPALAQWHQRPHATGDAGNSVFALHDEHDASNARVRDERIREWLARDGDGAALHLAYEMQRLENLLGGHRQERSLAHDDLVARLDALSRQVESLSQLLIQRTSVSSSVARLRLFFSRPQVKKVYRVR